MKNIKTITLLLLLATTLLSAKPLEKISLQLQWLDQFQFAGYYMAIEKGYYAHNGLDVELKKFNNSISVVDEVVSGRATYGIGRSSLIVDKSNGKKIVILASIFQSSPSIFLARKDSGIGCVKDFIGKRIMITSDVSDTVSLLAMLEGQGVKHQDIIKLKHSFNIDDLINKKTDLMSTYISNEPFLLKERGVEYTVFDPKDYGFDFYSDILFTTVKETKEHDNRDNRFKIASLKGWEYAFSHIDETVDLILKKYNPQHKSREALIYEAKELKKLAYYKNSSLGAISKNKIQRIYDIYNTLGLVKNRINIDEFVHSHSLKLEFTEEEEKFINKQTVIKYVFDPDWKPFEWRGVNGEHKGIISDFIKIIEEKSGLKFVAVNSNSWSEAEEKIKSKKVQMISAIGKIESRKKYLNYVNKNFISVPYVFLTRKDENYINGFDDIKNKKLAVIRNYAIEAILAKEKPNLKMIRVENIEKSFEMLKDKEIDVIILASTVAQYYISAVGKQNLKLAYITKYKLNLKIAFNKDVPKEVLSIVNKSLVMITPKQRSDIFHKWTNIKLVKQVNWEYIRESGFIIMLLFAFMIFHHRKLKRAVFEAKKEIKEQEQQNFQQSKLVQMGEMISMIAHQWRQPLNAISATGINLSLLSSMDKLKPEKVQESSKFIQDQCQKMSSTIDTFMHFVKPTNEAREFLALHAVNSVLDIMGSQLANHSIEVNIKVIEDMPMVGYEDLLEQVLINLLSNARDAFGEIEIQNKHINITIEEIDSIKLITVEDNAGGIPDDVAQKIFNPYFTTKEQGKGTGIGLYMSLDIMRKSFDGDLKYRAIDGGSCFEIFLK